LAEPTTRTFFSDCRPCAVLGAAGRTRTFLRLAATITPRFVDGAYFLLAPRTRTFLSVTTPCAVFGAAGRTRTVFKLSHMSDLLLGRAENADLLERPEPVSRLRDGREDADRLESLGHDHTSLPGLPGIPWYVRVVLLAGSRLRDDANLPQSAHDFSVLSYLRVGLETIRTFLRLSIELPPGNEGARLRRMRRWPPPVAESPGSPSGGAVIECYLRLVTIRTFLRLAIGTSLRGERSFAGTAAVALVTDPRDAGAGSH